MALDGALTLWAPGLATIVTEFQRTVKVGSVSWRCRAEAEAEEEEVVREAAPGQAGGWSWAGRRWGGKPGDAGPEVEVLYFRSLLDAEEDGGRVVLPSFEP